MQCPHQVQFGCCHLLKHLLKHPWRQTKVMGRVWVAWRWEHSPVAPVNDTVSKTSIEHMVHIIVYQRWLIYRPVSANVWPCVGTTFEWRLLFVECACWPVGHRNSKDCLFVLLMQCHKIKYYHFHPEISKTVLPPDGGHGYLGPLLITDSASTWWWPWVLKAHSLLLTVLPPDGGHGYLRPTPYNWQCFHLMVAMGTLGPRLVTDSASTWWWPWVLRPTTYYWQCFHLMVDMGTSAHSL
jgi:hypothetical protein